MRIFLGKSKHKLQKFTCGQEVHCHIYHCCSCNIETLICFLPLMWHLFSVSFFWNIIADHFKCTAWTFMNENNEPIVSAITACTLTKDFLFQIPIFPYLPWKSRTYFCFVVEKMEHKRWTVECMAFGSGWQIHYCLAHSSKQSKCCFGEWAVTVPAPRQHHTININKREKGRCPQGDYSEVHQLEMSPISLEKGEQVYSTVFTSFLHKTNFIKW